jgi:DNA-binding LytR/AlgR family response regulator
MERRLKPEGFVRIHRSRLVNWRRVREFIADRDHDPVVVLRSGQRLEASPAHLKDLQRRLLEDA